MIGKGAIEIRPATLSEVAKILDKREGTAGEIGFEQKTTHDYAKRYGRLKLPDAQEMVEELVKLEIKPEVAVKLADLLPNHKSQLLLVLSKDKADVSDKKVGQVEEIVAKFAKKAKKLELPKAEDKAAEAAAEAPKEEKKAEAKKE